MSNYNSQLQSNNADLQTVLQTLQTKAAGKEPILQDKTVTPTTSEQTVTADSGYDGLDTVTVNAIPNQYVDVSGATASESDVMSGKTFGAGEEVKTGTFTIDSELTTQDDLIAQIKTALDDKTSVVMTLQDKTVTPSATQQSVACDDGYIGLDIVVVEGDVNLVPENIKSGVTIFGVDGSFQGSSSASAPTVSTGFVQSTAEGSVIYSILNMDGNLSVVSSSLVYMAMTKKYRHPFDTALVANTPIVILTSGTITMPVTSEGYTASLISSGTGYAVYQYTT